MNITQILFSAKGRISRSVYWLSLGSLFVASFLWGFLTADSSSVNVEQGGEKDLSFSFSESSSMGMFDLILGLLILYISYVIYIKRFHDMGRSGWFSLLMLVPFVNVAVGLFWLGFVKGTEGANQYGSDPLGSPPE